jgi:hypothetical protein
MPHSASGLEVARSQRMNYADVDRNLPGGRGDVHIRPFTIQISRLHLRWNPGFAEGLGYGVFDEVVTGGESRVSQLLASGEVVC